MRKISVFRLIFCQISQCSYSAYFLTVLFDNCKQDSGFVINILVSFLEVLIPMNFLQSFLTTAKNVSVL